MPSMYKPVATLRNLTYEPAGVGVGVFAVGVGVGVAVGVGVFAHRRSRRWRRSRRIHSPRRSRSRGRVTATGLDADAVDLRVLRAGGELDHDLAARVGRGRERPGDGLVLASRGRVDVEVGEHRGAVDGHVEEPAPGGRQVGLSEVQRHRVRTPRGEAWDRVAHRPVSLVVEERGRRRVAGDLRDVNGVAVAIGAAAGVVLVGLEAAHGRGTARRDGDGTRNRGRSRCTRLGPRRGWR